MKVVILRGGLGTRLREETEHRPKPMVPVGCPPILWHLLKFYARHGHKEFILCLGHNGEVIKDCFRNCLWNTSDAPLKLGRNPQIRYRSDRDEEDWTVTLLETGPESQTGGRLRRALPSVEDDTFLFTNGDGLSDSDINAGIAFRSPHGAVAAMTAIKPSGCFRELAMEGRTSTAFREKPEQESGYINGGGMGLDKRVAGHPDDPDTRVFERGPLERLTREGQLKAFCGDGFRQCMETYREQQMPDQMWRSGVAPWKVW